MIDILRNVSLFLDLDEHLLKELADTAIRRTFPKDTTLFSRGDVSDSLYVIVYGRLKAIITDRTGKEIVLSVMGTGEYFGEIALFDREPRSATIVAKDETQVLIISRGHFKRILAQNTDMAFDIIRVLIKRLRRATVDIQSLAFKDVHTRVVGVLKKMSESNGEEYIINEKPTHVELAGMVYASREMVSRILNNLVRNGYLVFKKDHIVMKKDIPHTL
ncbi:MAG: Crp/Fnr family transcriptional regulator [Desulfobacteraceae bacterium]|nr:Crp/Fnr family transcriptional regulator [Desulfobacteraceae bacterium]